MDDYRKLLNSDPDGLLSYEWLVNNIEELSSDDLKALLANSKRVDATGQYIVSAARYLHSIDAAGYAPYVSDLIEAGIERDRERNYIGTLLAAIWGDDYKERASELAAADDNFRRIYKRIYSSGI